MSAVLLRADRERIDELADSVWGHVFCLLDAERNLDSDDAGKIAQAAVNAVRDGLRLVWEVERQ